MPLLGARGSTGRLDEWVGMGRKRRITVEEIDDTSAAEPRSRRRSAKASPAPSPRRAALAQETARTSATGERLRAAAQSGNETELRAVLEPLEPGDPALDAVDWYLRPTPPPTSADPHLSLTSRSDCAGAAGAR